MDDKEQDIKRQGFRYRKALQACAFCAVGALLIFVFYYTIHYWRLHRDARAVLGVVHAVQVGKSTGEEILRGSQATNVPMTTMQGSREIPSSECLAGDCTIRLSVNLESIFFTLRFKTRPMIFRRWVPASGMVVEFTIRKGVLAKLYVAMAAWAGENQYGATTEIRKDYSDGLWEPARFWDITRKEESGAYKSEYKYRYDTDVKIASNASPEQLTHALNFNTRCLLPNSGCTDCQMLPEICEDYAHGDWYYFSMPVEALAAFQKAVNSLPLRITSGCLTQELDPSSYDECTATPPEAAKKRHPENSARPFVFPIMTVSHSDDEGSFSYCTKKWRHEYAIGPRDGCVTFYFDPNGRLTRIKSDIEGIRSRP